jgi:hypothetical protein
MKRSLLILTAALAAMASPFTLPTPARGEDAPAPPATPSAPAEASPAAEPAADTPEEAVRQLKDLLSAAAREKQESGTVSVETRNRVELLLDRKKVLESQARDARFFTRGKGPATRPAEAAAPGTASGAAPQGGAPQGGVAARPAIRNTTGPGKQGGPTSRPTSRPTADEIIWGRSARFIEQNQREAERASQQAARQVELPPLQEEKAKPK